jgi:hypothetical protein
MSLVQRYGTRAPRGNSRRRVRHPDEPAPALSSYIHFCNDNRAEISQQLASESYNGLVRGGQIGKRAGEIWRRMTCEEKNPYIIRAQEDKMRYEREFAAYQNQDAEVEVPTSSSEDEYDTASEEMDTEVFSDASSTFSETSSGDAMSISGDELQECLATRIAELEERVSVLELASAIPACPEVTYTPVDDFSTRRLKNFKPVNLFIRANRDTLVEWELVYGTRRGIERKEMVKIVDKNLKRLWRTLHRDLKTPFEAQALRLHQNYINA